MATSFGWACWTHFWNITPSKKNHRWKIQNSFLGSGWFSRENFFFFSSAQFLHGSFSLRANVICFWYGLSIASKNFGGVDSDFAADVAFVIYKNLILASIHFLNTLASHVTYFFDNLWMIIINHLHVFHRNEDFYHLIRGYDATQISESIYPPRSDAPCTAAQQQRRQLSLLLFECGCSWLSNPINIYAIAPLLLPFDWLFNFISILYKDEMQIRCVGFRTMYTRRVRKPSFSRSKKL